MSDREYTLSDEQIAVQNALEIARLLPPSREMSLVITKLEEALLWLGQVKLSTVNEQK